MLKMRGGEIARNETRRGFIYLFIETGFVEIVLRKITFFSYIWKDFIIKIIRIGKNLSRDGYVYIKWGEINLWKLRYGKKSTCIELFSCAR